MHDPELPEDLALLFGPPPEPEPEEDKKPKFRCAGAKRTNPWTGKKICDYKAIHRWAGPCPGDPDRMVGLARAEALASLAEGKGCGNHYNCVPIKKGDGLGSSQTMTSFAALRKMKDAVPISTGLVDLDKVLGGGFFPGNTLMFGGEAGSGKSSLLLQVAVLMAQGGVRVFFASGEMTVQQNLAYAKRLLPDGDATDEVLERIGLFCDTDGIDIVDCIDRVMRHKAKVLFLDSIHLANHPDTEANMGSADQVDSVTQYVSSFCQKKTVASVYISHLNKAGDYKGAQTAQHAVDGLLMMDRRDFLGEDGEPLPGTWRDGESNIREIYWKRKSRQSPSGIRALMQVDEVYRFGPVDDFTRLRMSRLRPG